MRASADGITGHFWKRKAPALAGVAGAAMLLSAASALGQDPAAGIDTYNAINDENRRHTQAEIEIRNQQQQLRNDRRQGLTACQGIAAATGQNACATNLGNRLQQHQTTIDNRIRIENNTHHQVLQGLRGATPGTSVGVTPSGSGTGLIPSIIP